jgi:hypothetical protein
MREAGVQRRCPLRGDHHRGLAPHAIVAVTLALAAPVIVAALVNWNDLVKVIDAARGSGVDELREHGHDALEQVDAGSYNSPSTSSSSFITSRCAAHSIAEPRAIV